MFNSIALASANAFGVESKPAPMDVEAMLTVFGVVVGVIVVVTAAGFIYNAYAKSSKPKAK